MKNLFLKRATLFAKRFIPTHAKNDRILIVTTTALGDTLWATPAIENICRSFPNAYIAVLTSPIGMEVFQRNPHIDKLYLLKEPLSRHFFKLWKVLYREKFDSVLLFHASQRLTLPLCALIGASRVVGTAGINKGLDELLDSPLPNHAQHEIVRRLKIAETIGATTYTETLSYYLENRPEKQGVQIALHPGSKDAFKRWPISSFAEVGRALQKKGQIVITGGPAEKDLMEELAKQIPGAQIAETRSLQSLAQVYAQMDLVISNDTGPVHLACALNVPLIAIYASTDPALCGPHKAEKAIAIARRATCDPCLKRKCRQPFCFLQIRPEEVLAASMRVIS